MLDVFHSNLRSISHLPFIFCYGVNQIFRFPSAIHPSNHSHNEVKPLKSFAVRLGICQISLNGLYGEETWYLQPLHFTAQRFEENKCRNCQWSQTISESSIHPATFYSQRWTQATFWKELCSCRSWQQTSINIQVSHKLNLYPFSVCQVLRSTVGHM